MFAPRWDEPFAAFGHPLAPATQVVCADAAKLKRRPVRRIAN
jgi:hypothetical protein